MCVIGPECARDRTHKLSQRYRAVFRGEETVTIDRQTPISSETDTTFSIDTQEQVRRRAFEIYEQRGREDGHELDDWLQAEAEVLSQQSKAMSATA